jgi:hypothetical protein
METYLDPTTTADLTEGDDRSELRALSFRVVTFNTKHATLVPLAANEGTASKVIIRVASGTLVIAGEGQEQGFTQTTTSADLILSSPDPKARILLRSIWIGSSTEGTTVSGAAFVLG